MRARQRLLSLLLVACYAPCTLWLCPSGAEPRPAAVRATVALPGADDEQAGHAAHGRYASASHGGHDGHSGHTGHTGHAAAVASGSTGGQELHAGAEPETLPPCHAPRAPAEMRAPCPCGCSEPSSPPGAPMGLGPALISRLEPPVAYAHGDQTAGALPLPTSAHTHHPEPVPRA